MLTEPGLFVLDYKIGTLAGKGQNRVKLSEDKKENRVTSPSQGNHPDSHRK